MKFKNALVRRPSKSMINGITTSNLGQPDFDLALKQHDEYIVALEQCKLNVTILEADENFPDSCFVEDVAVLCQKCAVITHPGAASRQGEEIEMKNVLKKFYSSIEHIKSPGTLEGGDIMMAGNHFFIGLSKRTNENGAQQLISILNKYSYTGSIVSLEKVLHLKTGVAYLENNNLLACGEFIHKPEFKNFNKIIIDANESYAANCIWVNDNILIPEGYPITKKEIEKAGFETIIIDTSEFRKLDGGLSCLSLRF